MADDIADLAFQLVQRLAAPRHILGIAGPPGSGKSTLAESVVQCINGLTGRTVAAVLAADGFHLTNAELDRRGLRPRKGAPQTFDVAGLIELLSRLRRTSRTVLAPIYSRDLHEPVPHAVRIDPHVRLVILEGNYLLVDDGPWAAVRGQIDEAWYLDVPCEVCMRRVFDRHVRGGCSAEQAARKIEENDRLNYEAVAVGRARADRILALSDMTSDLLESR
jgi:pantothenate kinase